MNNVFYAITVILALFFMIVLTRGLPFLFARFLKDNPSLNTVGRHLPAHVMLLLVIYEIGMDHFLRYPFAIPAIIALMVLIIVHIWKHQVLLSIFIGTTVFILLTHLFTN